MIVVALCVLDTDVEVGDGVGELLSVVALDSDTAVELVTVMVVVVVVLDCGGEVEFVMGVEVTGSIEVVPVLRVVLDCDTEVVSVTLVFTVGGL